MSFYGLLWSYKYFLLLCRVRENFYMHIRVLWPMVSQNSCQDFSVSMSAVDRFDSRIKQEMCSGILHIRHSFAEMFLLHFYIWRMQIKDHLIWRICRDLNSDSYYNHCTYYLKLRESVRTVFWHNSLWSWVVLFKQFCFGRIYIIMSWTSNLRVSNLCTVSYLVCSCI